VGSKGGESCASSILGIVVTGEASAAAAAGVLGIYATNCAIVTGE